MAKETARGREITIHFEGKRCIHSRNCVLSHPDVFVPMSRANGFIPMPHRPMKWR